jgi:hypothetical protein
LLLLVNFIAFSVFSLAIAKTTFMSMWLLPFFSAVIFSVFLIAMGYYKIAVFPCYSIIRYVLFACLLTWSVQLFLLWLFSGNMDEIMAVTAGIAGGGVMVFTLRADNRGISNAC